MPQRPLYLMTKPPPDVRERIWRFDRTDKARPAELLHITLLPFFDLTEMPAAALPHLTRLLDDFEEAAFRAIFDRITERKSVSLSGSEEMRGVSRLQANLTGFLKRRDFPYFGHLPRPHLTLNYRADGLGNETIDPISWTVTDIVLIESVYGERRHIERGRWPLTEPDGGERR